MDRSDLNIPSRLLRGKNRSPKKFIVDTLSNDTVKFNSVSVDFVFDFCDAFLQGSRFPGIKIYELTQNVENFDAGATGTIDDEGRFCLPFKNQSVEVEKELLREKKRVDWSTNDVVNFGILPEMRLCKESQIVVDNITEEKFVGNPFQGAFVSQARNCKFSELVEALRNHFKTVKDEGKRYVWLDIFSANQPHLCDDQFDKDEQQKIYDLLSHGLHSAIESFEDLLLFFDDFYNPQAIQRAWCIWELYGMARNDLNFKIISSSVVMQSMEEQFLVGGLNVLQVLAMLNLQQMQCYNPSDKKMITEAVERLPGGFSELKAKVTEKMRKWVLNFANNIRLQRLNDLKVKSKEKKVPISKLSKMDDGRCLHRLGTLLRDFGEIDLAIAFGEAASEVFAGVRDKDGQRRCNNLLGVCYQAKNDFHSALKIYQLDLDYHLSQKKKDEPNIAILYANIANAYSELNEPEKAEEFFKKTEMLFTKLYGKASAEMFETLLDKMSFYNSQKHFNDAIHLGEELLEMSKKVFTGENLGTARVFQNLSISYAGINQKKKALDLQLESLRIKLEILGPKHPDEGVDYLNLGNLYNELGDQERAENNYLLAKRIHEKSKVLVQGAKVCQNLGLLYMRQQKADIAIQNFQEARKGYVTAFGEKNENVANIDALLRELGQ